MPTIENLLSTNCEWFSSLNALVISIPCKTHLYFLESNLLFKDSTIIIYRMGERGNPWGNPI